MANQLLQLELNKGLDLVTPPLSIEAGSLIGCLNYELTNIAGVHRIDGYERYDGYPNGAVYDFYVMTITGYEGTIAPGSIIARGDDNTPYTDIGIVLESLGSNQYAVSPFVSLDRFSLDEVFLLLSDHESFLTLQSGDGLLRLVESGGLLGSDFIIKSPSGGSSSVSIGSNIIPAKDLYTPQQYIDLIRTYSSLLRSFVQDAPGTIAGMYWHRDRLVCAIDMAYVTVTAPDTDSLPVVGSRVRLQGTIYRVARVDITEVVSGQRSYNVYLIPIGVSGVVNDDLTLVNYAETASTVYETNVTANGLLVTSNSLYATLGYYNNPEVSAYRGFTYYPQASTFTFNTGTWGTEDGPTTSLVSGAEYYVVGTGGVVMKAKMTSVNPTDTSPTWGSGTATGIVEMVVTEVVSGDRDYIVAADEIHTEYPTTGSSKIMSVVALDSMATLAGTKALDLAGTMYTWNTFNFYGQSSTLTSYGTTGASRAFWVNNLGYGNVRGIADAALDLPKYNAYHEGRLVLAYPHGSVLMSVIGDATNFSGLKGAVEITTGDDITGLLELAGNSLGVFGRRSIRKITGSTDSDLAISTISSNEGCIDYTAVMVGMTPVYCTINGITSLEQTAAYGDFIGQRISDPISTWLRPKLVRNRPGGEKGGVIGAYPIRTKGQYRLVLESGEEVVVTFTANGPRSTILNYGLTGISRIPYCWSSAVTDEGVERVHCRWDNTELSTRAIELETGWGFDGRMFNHYFETAHVFAPNAQYSIGVEKVRMFGQGHGLATLDLKAAGVEDDFNQKYHYTVQDISMPINPDILYDRMQPVTSIVDSSNNGLGIKLRIEGSVPENSTLTEPAHICQVLVLHVRSQGALDG